MWFASGEMNVTATSTAKIKRGGGAGILIPFDYHALACADRAALDVWRDHEEGIDEPVAAVYLLGIFSIIIFLFCAAIDEFLIDLTVQDGGRNQLPVLPNLL